MNTSKQLPCKQAKCILQATCKQKKHIDCDSIREYFNYLLKHDTKVKAWYILSQHFENIKSIAGPIIINENKTLRTVIYKDAEPNTGLDMEYYPV